MVGGGGVAEHTGRDVLVEVLESEGVRHVFGNPGTTELPLMDALAGRDGPRYVLGLQEAAVVGMADGYAESTGRPAFVNLHTSAGLGNAIGNLTCAQANRAPLVVTAGQQDRRHLFADPLLAGDLVGLARPVSKWGHEIRGPGELGTYLRRAFRDAETPPAGPVFCSIPMDVLDEEAPPAPPPSRRDGRAVAGSLGELADLLAAAAPDRLAIVAGDDVAGSCAVDALVAVAEALGAPVFGSPFHGTTVFPAAHPLWRGMLGRSAAGVRKALSGFERVFLVGGQAFMSFPYTPGSPLPEDAELLHLSSDPTQVGRTWPTDLGLVGDIGASLEALLPLLRERAPAGGADRAADALAAARERRAGEMAEADAQALANYPATPMDPGSAVHALLRALPDDIPVVDESVTTAAHVRRLHRSTGPGQYFFSRGGGLGWGMPAAVGVSLGLGGGPVLCVVGDGAAMYTPQALWTAAREQLPVVVAVVDNAQYLILKNALRQRGKDSAATGRFVGMDLDRPRVDFCALAGSLGVDATYVDKAGDVGDAARAAFASGRPHLLHLPIGTPTPQ
ncbi:MAG: thiamine pyrophosphate-binding protein [Streptosporangiales bacterium]|nr:thiamine pyrophosphate-binding protein [Streptosporangiales bacterium]